MPAQRVWPFSGGAGAWPDSARAEDRKRQLDWAIDFELPVKRPGIVGSGQLAVMLAEAAGPMGLNLALQA